MSDLRPPGAPPRRTPLPIEQPFGSGARMGGIVLYGLLVVALAGAAIYGAVVANYPLTSGYVAAPAIGALWFALRLFMMLSARK